MADDALKDAKDAFKLAYDAEAEQRIMSLDDLRFGKLGEQWPDAVKRQRELDGRPCLTLNRMPSFMKQVINDARQNRPAVKCHPVGSGAQRETATILDGLIRNIEYSSNADIAYDTALDFAVASGRGYFVIRTDYTADDAFELDIQIERVSNPFSIYGDPHSTAADSSDWNSAFITDLIPKDEFKRRWKGADTSDFEGAGFDSKDTLWFQGEAIQVAEYWKRDEVTAKLLQLSDGSVMMEPEYLKLQDFFAAQQITVKGVRPVRSHRVTQYIMNGSEILETNPWRGKYIPIVPVYGEEVNIEGKRYFLSLIHFAKDSQRQYNYWRTTTTELIALAPKAPFIGAVGQFDTDKNWKTANRVNHDKLEYDPVPGEPPPVRQPFAGPPAGALQEALNASDDMKNIMGLHDASLGARSNETSGRAIMARQREGDVATFNFIDNLARGIKHAGRIIIDLIPKVYDSERIIRCIKEDGSNYSVPINQPVVPKQPPADPMMAMQGPGRPPMQQGQQPDYEPVPQEQAEQMKAIAKVFDLTAGKYDVTVEVGPSFTTRREEAAQQMMEFIRVLPGAAPLIGDLLAKSLDWPGSEEIGKRLQAMLPPQVQGQNPQLQQAEQAINVLKQQLQQCQQQLQDKSLDGQIKQQELQLKAQELQVKLMEAQTHRDQMIQDAQLRAMEIQKPEAQVPPQQIDPLEVERVKQDWHKLSLEAYGKETDRLKVMGPAMTPQVAGVVANQAGAEAGEGGDISEGEQPPMHVPWHEQLSQALAQALITADAAKKPKRAIAQKQPDGSFVMGEVDEPQQEDARGNSARA